MWKQIRGLGLSYGYSMLLKIHQGLLYNCLYMSASLLEAYKQAKKIIDEHLSQVLKNIILDYSLALLFHGPPATL